MALTRAAEVAVLVGRSRQAEGPLRESLALLRNGGDPGFVADSLELVAVVLSDRGGHASAARLLAASDALRRTRGEPVRRRPVHAEVERARSGTARALGPEAFAAEWARGLALSSGHAVRRALAEL